MYNVDESLNPFHFERIKKKKKRFKFNLVLYKKVIIDM